ncbi:hypothetical protein [Amphibacillus cookii]|uniref:hypothetical protein n=1 Tax=Amphibacillus cookii TaxID=767787 RepID=UPI001959EE24|nr:hypothetical protein [Amphibacillus cookii]MBM7539838.1 hypothetical protein [Amphibacillus cookii]
MKKRIIVSTVIVVFALLTIVSYFMFQWLNDNQDIEDVIKQEFRSLGQYVENVYAIEYPDDDRALIFYSWSHPDFSNFGVMELEKTWRGWQFVEAISNRMERKNAWLKGVYAEIGDHAILRGPTWANVDKIEIITDDGREYIPDIGKSEWHMWYLILEDEPFEEATFILYDSDGEVLWEEVLQFDLNLLE